MGNTVSVATIVMICIDLALGFLIPAVLGFVMKKKSGGSLKAFFVGCGVMFVFAFVLESIAHNIILTTIGSGIPGNIWLYGLYGGFMAGLFEETGRFLAFKTILKKNWDNDGNALMYGAGHGGFEAFWLLVIGMLNNLIFAVLINSNTTSVITGTLQGEELAAVEHSIEQLCATSPFLFMVSPIERLAAILAHISLSVLVWFAAKKGGKYFRYYPLALVLHMLLDTTVVILNSYVSSIAIVEVCAWAFAIAFAFIARYVWMKATYF